MRTLTALFRITAPSLLLCVATCLPSPARGQAARALVLERVEVEGNSRTSADLVRERSGLQPGPLLDPTLLAQALETLRHAGLFRDVDLFTRPGSEPGRVVAVIRVQENRPRLQLGAGYEDLSGWYVIPLRLDLDNLTGHGEALRLDTRLGYRVAGLVLHLRSSPESASRRYWEARLRGEGQDRVYFLNDTEVIQRVSKGGFDIGAGGPLPQRLSWGVLLTSEEVEPESTASVYRDRQVLGRRRGDPVAFADLPAGIQNDLGKRRQTRVALSFGGDGRRGPGLLVRGLRGRLRTEAVFSTGEPFYLGSADVRAYVPLRPGLLLAARVRAAAVSAAAPFYERLYLGGVYTLRGYPSQSLSPPAGNLRRWASSLELRSSWVGPPGDPRVTGILFADLGWAGDTGLGNREGLKAGVGYGLRLRVPWIERLGLDVGVPLSESPFAESFHVNLSLGWTY